MNVVGASTGQEVGRNYLMSKQWIEQFLRAMAGWCDKRVIRLDAYVEI